MTDPTGPLRRAELSRRRLLGVAGGVTAASAAALVVPSWWRPPGPGTGQVLASRAPLPTAFSRPLLVPPTARPVSTRDGTDRYTIIQRETTLDVVPGLPTPAWGYDGLVPGPTIEARRGRPTVITHRNELPVPTVVHLHGAATTPESDGYPTDLVLPVDGWDHHLHSEDPAHPMHDPRAVVTRGERTYTYGAGQRAATLWYHDHRMDFTGPAVYHGLAGFHLVRDEEDDAAGLPHGERELPLMLTDRSFDSDGSFLYPAADPDLVDPPGVTADYVEGVLGDVVLVNGVPWPEHEVAGARHRLRLLNASNARRYELALEPPPPGGGGLVQVGADQGLLERPVRHDVLPMGPAERYDVVVDFAAYRPGQLVELVNRAGEGSTRRVLRFRVGGPARDDSAPVEGLRLPALPSLRREEATVVRDFGFRGGRMEPGRGGGGHGWLVGGQPFSPTSIAAHPRRGAVEIWRFVADVHHPVHLHLVGFRILSRGGGAPARHDAGLKDTVDLRPGESAEVIARFEGERGRYVFHCHNAEHEDLGMMANFEVV